MRILTLLILILFPSWGFSAPQGPGSGPPPLVTVAVISEQDVNPPMEYVGHVEAVQAVNLIARVQGFIEKVEFKEGDDVKAGDLLYVIEQAPYQAKADADKARVAQAEAALANADQRLKRLQTASPASVSETDLDAATASQLQAKAQLEEAWAVLSLSELNLDYTVITAPINGRIGRTAYTFGNLVDSSSGPLSRIVQLDPIRVLYSISENDLAAVQEALNDAEQGRDNLLLTPRLRLANGEILNVKGRVEFLDNTVDPATGTIAVWALFENKEKRLLPGQYVTVMVTRSKPSLMPVVPQSAVLVSQQGSYVLVVTEGNVAVARPIITSVAVGSNWAVESGLSAGDKVIVEGIQKVQPGQPVQIATGQQIGR